MTKTKIDLSPERQLVTHLIISLPFAREIMPLLKPRYFKTRYAQIVSKWVQEYYNRFDDVPGKAIEDIFIEKKASLRDEEEQNSVQEFLQRLSDDSVDPSTNLQFYIDQAIKYLKTRSLELTVSELQESLATGDPLAGEAVIANYKRVGRPEGDGYSILENPGDIISAFTEEDEIVVTYPGELGKVVGPGRRGDLVSFIGQPKKGKTFALIYSAEVAMSLGHKVAMITLEMPKAQIIRRAWQSISGSPRHDQVVRIPYFAPEIEKGEEVTDDTRWRVEYKDVKKEAVRLDSVEQVQDSMRLMFRGGDCRFIPMTQYITTVKDIEDVLDNLYYYNNYLTDVLIVDYADILGTKMHDDYRHQLNDIWSNLRKIAQERNILVITATQTNRAVLDGADIELANIAEDMRKLGHVSKLIALNQSKDEKTAQRLRWKVLIDRDEPFDYDEAVTLQSLKIGRFVLDSRYSSKVDKIGGD